MPVIVCLFDEPTAERLRGLWESLANEFSLCAPAPPPHLTLHAAQGYEMGRVERMVRSLTRSLPPFVTRGEGLGLFRGESLTLYLPVVRTPRLSLLHRNVFEEVRDHATAPEPYHHPDRWMPHVTLAQEGLTEEKLGEVVRYLARLDLSFELPIIALAAVVEGEGPQVALAEQFSG